MQAVELGSISGQLVCIVVIYFRKKIQKIDVCLIIFVLRKQYLI